MSDAGDNLGRISGKGRPRVYRINLHADMAAFDALPHELRDRLRNAVAPFAAHVYLAHWRRTRSVEKTLAIFDARHAKVRAFLLASDRAAA
jgi:hypothetical protein